jgi:hypothetical protein
MLKLADLEKEYLVPCAHCAKPMPGWELFCPSCNAEQSLPEAQHLVETTDTAAIGAVEPSRPQQEDWESIVPTITTTAANEEIGFELGRVRPGSVWQDAVPVTSSPPQVTGERAFGFGRMTLGLAAMLVALLLFALMHDAFVLRDDGRNTATQAVAANAPQVRIAASHPDSNGVERASAPNDGGRTKADAVPESNAVADRAGRALPAKDEPIQDVVITAVQALGLSETAAQPAPKPLPQAAPMVAPPPVSMGVADSTDKECTGAHAALALCRAR